MSAILLGLWAGVSARRAALAVGAVSALGAAIIGVVSVEAAPVALAGAAGVLFVAIACRSLAAGVAIFVVLTFFDRATVLTSQGLSPVKLAGLVLALLWALAALVRGSDERSLLREHPRFAAGVILFLGWAFASVLWAPDPGLTISAVSRLALVVVFVFVLFSAIREPRHLRWLIWAFLIGVLFAQAIGFVGVYAPSNQGRLSGGFDDPNELAAVIVPGLSLAAFAFVAFRSRIRWLFVPCTVLFGISLIHTDSQAGLLALGVALILGLVFAGPSRRMAATAIAAFVLVATCYYTFVTPPTALETITSSSNVSARESLWTVAGDILTDHPIIGTGAGNYVAVSSLYTLEDLDLPRVDAVFTPHIVHNTYLEVLAELGMVGFIGFLGLIAGSIILGVRAVRIFERTGDWEMQMLGRGLIIGTITMLVASIFATATYEKQLWLLITSGPILYSLARRRPEGATASDVEGERQLLL